MLDRCRKIIYTSISACGCSVLATILFEREGVCVWLSAIPGLTKRQSVDMFMFTPELYPYRKCQGMSSIFIPRSLNIMRYV